MMIFTNPAHTYLEISSELLASVNNINQKYSNPVSAWNGYLNHICLETILPWLQEEYIAEADIAFPQNALASIWEFVNGTTITIEDKRLILIPTENIDRSEFSVPLEWIDIPEWMGDYYLAVQINLEEKFLTIWGYTTHQQLKEKGIYNKSDRTYNLDSEELIEELNYLWVMRQLSPHEITQAVINPLPTLAPQQAKEIIANLVKEKNPRLIASFQDWAALLINANWRNSLYQQRINPIISEIINLSQWFNNLFETSWQSLDSLLDSQRNLAYSFRSSTVSNQNLIQRGKIIKIGSYDLVLGITIESEPENKLSIGVQLYPLKNSYLPENIQLKLLSDLEQEVQSVKSKQQDQYIQLKHFKVLSGKSFTIQIRHQETVIREKFIS